MKRSIIMGLLIVGSACVPDSSGLGTSGDTGSTSRGGDSTSHPPTSDTVSVSSTGSSTTDGNTDGPALAIAGELIVDLDAQHPSAGEMLWFNAGSGGDFLRVGSPEQVTVDGHVGIELFDDPAPLSLYESEQHAPKSIVGLDPTRTVEVWAWNDALAGEETMVAWGMRGGPTGSNITFNFGDNPDFGAVGHWSEPDLGWFTNPNSDDWHHLVYTYDGTTTRVYVDGVLDNSEVLGRGVIDTHSDTPIVLGAQHTEQGGYERRGSLVLAKVRVHSEVLDADGVANNYALEQSEF